MAAQYVVVEAARLAYRDRIFRDRNNPFELPDKTYLANFRVSRQMVGVLCDVLRPHLEGEVHRPGSLPVEVQVLTALQFLGTGSFQNAVSSSMYTGLSQRSVSTCITKFVDGMIATMMHQITFDMDNRSLINRQVLFRDYCRLPSIIGAIDCTHVPIISRPGHPVGYINRKGRNSINVEMACDKNMRIMHVNARWPGSTHDAFIWRNSGLRTILENVPDDRGHLLGDSGYPLEPWLLTPISVPNTNAEVEYNERHRRGRNVIESTGGELQYSAEKVCRIVAVCSILHNLCVDERLDLPDEAEAEPDEMDDMDQGLDLDDEEDVANILQRGRLIRQHLVDYCRH